MDKFDLLDRKAILDSDGFYTEYSWYVNLKTGEHVMVFGDSNIYKPEDGYYDAEFDTEDEAQEWFDSYEGYDEDLDESVVRTHAKKITFEATESTEPAHREASRFMYRGYIVDKCEDGFKIFTVSEWQFGKGLRLSEATVATADDAKNWIDNTLRVDQQSSNSNTKIESKKTEAFTSQNMVNDFIEAIRPIYFKWDHLIEDFDQFVEILSDVAKEILEEEDIEECTQASSINQHKKDSIDLIDESAHPSEETLIAVQNALDKARIRYQLKGIHRDRIIVSKSDFNKASEIRNKIDPEYTVTVARYV